MTAVARKAVVKTEDVQAVLAEVNTIITSLDSTHQATEFDRGGRKGGFAEYKSDDSVVRSFDTKDEALSFYTATLSGMRTVLSLVSKTESKPAAKAPAKTADKPSA